MLNDQIIRWATEIRIKQTTPWFYKIVHTIQISNAGTLAVSDVIVNY